jgi:hypothetical protein
MATTFAAFGARPMMAGQMLGMFGAPAYVAAPSITDVTLLERTCRTAMFGVSRIVSIHLGLGVVLLLVAFILLLGGRKGMSHTMVNFVTALLSVAALVIFMDMFSGKGFFQPFSMTRESTQFFGLLFVALVLTWVFHNLFEDQDWATYLSMGLLAVAAGCTWYLRYTQARVSEQYINAKAALPGYMRPYRTFIQQLDAQIDNAIFSGKGQEAAVSAATEQYQQAKAALGVVMGRFATPENADRAVRSYLASASSLLAALGAPEQPNPDASAPALAQLASRNLNELLRM